MSDQELVAHAERLTAAGKVTAGPNYVIDTATKDICEFTVWANQLSIAFHEIVRRDAPEWSVTYRQATRASNWRICTWVTA